MLKQDVKFWLKLLKPSVMFLTIFKHSCKFNNLLTAIFKRLHFIQPEFSEKTIVSIRY